MAEGTDAINRIQPYTASRGAALPLDSPGQMLKYGPMRNLSTSPRQRTALILKDVPGKGRGVFAGQAFRPGDEVLQFLGDLKDVSEFSDLTHALQVGPRAFLSASGELDDYVNHSCDPNCGIRDDQGRVVLFALRPIANTDEITFDYATTQAGGFWKMTCQCGAPNCRKTIGDFSDMPKERQQFFIKQGAVLPYLLK